MTNIIGLTKIKSEELIDKYFILNVKPKVISSSEIEPLVTDLLIFKHRKIKKIIKKFCSRRILQRNLASLICVKKRLRLIFKRLFLFHSKSKYPEGRRRRFSYVINAGHKCAQHKLVSVVPLFSSSFNSIIKSA